jgi:hypothetical protein
MTYFEKSNSNTCEQDPTSKGIEVNKFIPADKQSNSVNQFHSECDNNASPANKRSRFGQNCGSVPMSAILLFLRLMTWTSSQFDASIGNPEIGGGNDTSLHALPNSEAQTC